jgi:hypothetical protein
MVRRSKNVGLVLGTSVAVAAAVVAMARPAAAHISLEEGGTHKSRYGDGEIKAGPCGKTGGTRGTNVYTYAPGQKITVAVIETIPHPGYFRFAFDNDGDDAFIEPRSIKPIDPKRKCPNDPTDKCGMSDFYNSPAVLPNMDNLSPHLTATFGTKYSWEVTLPDVECTNCTLQLIQVMEDDLTHGPRGRRGRRWIYATRRWQHRRRGWRDGRSGRRGWHRNRRRGNDRRHGWRDGRSRRHGWHRHRWHRHRRQHDGLRRKRGRCRWKYDRVWRK